MRFSKIKDNDIANGIGINMSVWTQGCPHHCKGCFNHGKKWKLYCNEVERSLGYRITRTQKYEDIGLEKPVDKEQIKYIVKCSGCGTEFPRKRLCNIVRNPEKYKCGKCGNILYLQDKKHHIL